MTNKLIISLLGIGLLSTFAFADVDLKVTGIVYSDKTMAIVNGELVKEGDLVSGCKVTKIGQNYVEFTRGDTHLIEYVGGRGVKTDFEKKPKAEKAKKQTGVRKPYYQELLDKREKAKAELKKVEQRNIDAQEAIKGKIEALRGTGATDLLSPHSAKDEEEQYKGKNTWP